MAAILAVKKAMKGEIEKVFRLAIANPTIDNGLAAMRSAKPAAKYKKGFSPVNFLKRS